jgi:hypothetical protein
VALPGYRAEPVPSDLPETHGIPVAAGAPAAPIESPPDSLLDIDAPPPRPVSPPPPDPVPAVGVPPILFAAPAKPVLPVPVAGTVDDKIYVERRKPRASETPSSYKKKAVTPLMVILVALLALAALGVVYRPQLVSWLRQLWEQRIQGKLPPRKPASAPAPVPAGNTGPPGDSPDVIIAPDPPKRPSVPPVKKPAVPPAAPVVSPAPVPAPAPASVAPASEGPAEPPPPPPDSVSTNDATPLPATEAGAKELIDRLLHATAARQVQPFVLDGAKLAPALTAYFKAAKYVPVSAWSCELTSSEKVPGSSDRRLWQFKVTTDTVNSGFPVLVEQTDDGLRVDWELFMQCRDMELVKWAANPAAPPRSFYAGLQRRHPFPDMLPGKDPNKYLAFAYSSPILGEAASYAFISRESSLAPRAGKLYDFGEPPSAPVLELAHKDGHIEITGISREDWRIPVRK